MNSFILTHGGAALVINGHPYTIDKSHSNYDLVVEHIRNKSWAPIPGLINISTTLVKFANGKVLVDPDAGVVLFGNREVHNVLVDHMLMMNANGFDIEPMAQFLANLYTNPNPTTIEALYGWMQHNNVTITEDGCLIAYKRVRDDYKSFYDQATVHTIGQPTSISRSVCDEDNRNTCSRGLHFCSHEYLPEYHGGQGRVLLLKINPRDVTAIPNDYGFAKGRTCRYEVIGELEGEARVRIETEEVLNTPVLTANTNANATVAFRTGYAAGYKDGRGKKTIGTSVDYTSIDEGLDLVARRDACNEYDAGYDAGRRDGRAKKPNLYNAEIDSAPTETGQLADQVISVISDILGLPEDDITPALNLFTDLNVTRLEVISLIRAFEDIFDVKINNTEKMFKVNDFINLLDKLTKS